MTQTKLPSVTMHTLGSPCARHNPGWDSDTFAMDGTLIGQDQCLGADARQLPAIVWTTDKGLRFTTIEGSGLAQLNLRPDQGVGTSLHDFLPNAETTQSILTAHRRALGGLAINFEFTLGGYVFFGTAEPLFDATGEMAGTISVVLNITERAHAEREALDQVRQLQEARKVESLRRLAGGMAHNFNNLLSAVMSNTALAESHLPIDSPARALLRQANEASQAAADLTSHLLLYATRQPRAREDINLSRLIATLRPFAQTTVSPKVNLVFDLSEDLPLILGDPDQLGQVVRSLLFNASDALGDSDGIIRLRTQAIHVDRSFLAKTFLQENLPEGNYVWFQVSDTGCGMEEDTQRFIFEPFFSTKFTGRGLGLAAVLSIVNDHQGTIAVSSKPGLGTTFHILLPCLDKLTPLVRLATPPTNAGQAN